MTIQTKHLGEVAFEKENIIHFNQGLPGFEDEKEFLIVLSVDEELPFHHLQAVANPEIAFIITNPFLFIADYDFEIVDETVLALDIKDAEDLSVYCIASIPDEVVNTTLNIAAPIVINNKNNSGKQVILQEDGDLKYFIFNRERNGDA